MRTVRTFVADHRQLAVGVVIGALVAAWAMPTGVDADTTEIVPRRIASAPPSERMHRDRDVVRMLRDVSTQRLRQDLTALVDFGTRNTLSSQDDPERGIGAAVDYMVDAFEEIAATAGGRMDVERQTFTQTIAGQEVPITNVVATLHGTQPESTDRMYVISGHLDTRCSQTNNGECDAPGANDDGSGVVSLLEAARVMAPHSFDATIKFMAVSGEEQGLLGSTYFAEQAVQQGWDIEGMLNFDVVGNTVGGSGLSTPRRIRVFSEGVPWTETTQQANRRRTVGGENDGPSRQLARYLETVAETYTPDFEVWMINRQDRFGRGGDHRPFLQRGYSAVRFSEPFENYDQQHQTPRVEDGRVFGDFLEYVDFDYLTNVTQLQVASLASLANAPAIPEDAELETGGGRDPYSVTVSWDIGEEPDLAGYEIVWRDSTSPVWTDYRSFGVVDEAEVVNLSRDNTMVGVRAVDRDGNKSPVAFASR